MNEETHVIDYFLNSIEINFGSFGLSRQPEYLERNREQFSSLVLRLDKYVRST